MGDRKPRKWFSVRTDFYGVDAGRLGIYKLSPQAVGLWMAALAYASRWSLTYVHRNHLGMFAKRPSRIVAELVEHGFLIPTEDCYQIAHEGVLWRRGNANDGVRPAIPQSIRQAVLDRDGETCAECAASDDLTIDHIWPYSKGGTDALNNLRVLCRPCNSRKGNRV